MGEKRLTWLPYRPLAGPICGGADWLGHAVEDHSTLSRTPCRESLFSAGGATVDVLPVIALVCFGA